MPTLVRGDSLPAMVTSPPGPVARDLARSLADHVAPGIDTLYRGQPSIVWREALGSNVLDVDGNLYIDLTSGFGVAAVGHRHPRVVAAITKQSSELLHALGDVNTHPRLAELATRLTSLAPVDDAQMYPAISGAEAVEIALKTAVLATRRRGILAFDPSYHGLTFGALAAGSRPAFRAPFAAHLSPHVVRCPFGASREQLATTLASREIACVVVEPVVGREGVIFPPAGWLTSLAEACRDHGTLLLLDEIFTGFGRTGQLFAAISENVRPDLLCCGKALGGGVPIAAVIGRREVFQSWRTEGEALHTATFTGNPLACAAALAVLDILKDEALAERAAALGPRIAAQLAPWPSTFAAVAEVRGRGLLWGVELKSAAAASALAAGALQRGVLLLAGGEHGTVAQIAPPLTISEPQLGAALAVLETVLRETPP